MRNLVDPKAMARRELRQQLAWLGLVLLGSGVVLFVTGLFMQALAVYLALFIGLYIFVVTHPQRRLKPVLVEDALFWLGYGALLSVTSLAELGVCGIAPQTSIICQRVADWWMLLWGFPLTVTILFWGVVRTLHLIKWLWATGKRHNA